MSSKTSGATFPHLGIHWGIKHARLSSYRPAVRRSRRTIYAHVFGGRLIIYEGGSRNIYTEPSCHVEFKLSNKYNSGRGSCSRENVHFVVRNSSNLILWRTKESNTTDSKETNKSVVDMRPDSDVFTILWSSERWIWHLDHKCFTINTGTITNAYSLRLNGSGNRQLEQLNKMDFWKYSSKVWWSYLWCYGWVLCIGVASQPSVTTKQRGITKRNFNDGVGIACFKIWLSWSITLEGLVDGLNPDSIPPG